METTARPGARSLPLGHGELLGRLTQIFVETVQGFYVRRAAHEGAIGAKTGAVTAVQRASSDMRLNPHLHTIALDGAWSEQGNGLVFAGLGHLKTSEVGEVLEHAVRRIERHLDRRALLGTRDDAILLVGVIALSYPVGLALDPWFLLPVLNAAPAWWIMTRRLRAGDLRGAILLMLVFPLALAVFGTISLALWPTTDGLPPRVFNGPEYREEMFHWIRFGGGTEGNWRLFLPLHITHLVVFVFASLLTGSLVSITGGAVLTNYMDGYVASIHRAGAPLWATVLFGWQPWAISRVAAFCILGVVLADPLLSRVLRYPAQPWKKLRPWVLVAATLILVDWTLKAALAPTWGRVLNSAIPVNLPPAFPESPHQGHH